MNPLFSAWKPYGLMTESDSSDFHALRQGFKPAEPALEEAEGLKIG